MSKLNKASGYAFSAGFILGKIRYLPISIIPNIVTTVATVASLGAGLIGYFFWSLASNYYPNHQKHEHAWYGFAQYKEQHLASAIIGTLASVFGIAGFFLPVFYPPAACLFLCSNIFWCISEYHKFKNPPLNDLNYSQSRQESYVNYTISMTAIAANTALAAVLVFFFPLITVPLVLATTIITVGLSVLSLEFWLDFNFGEHEKNHSSPDSGSSHRHMMNRLNLINRPVVEIEMALIEAIRHDSPLTTARNPELDTDNDELLANQACNGPG